jgi:hypothetical protein
VSATELQKTTAIRRSGLLDGYVFTGFYFDNHKVAIHQHCSNTNIHKILGPYYRHLLFRPNSIKKKEEGEPLSRGQCSQTGQITDLGGLDGAGPHRFQEVSSRFVFHFLLNPFQIHSLIIQSFGALKPSRPSW